MSKCNDFIEEKYEPIGIYIKTRDTAISDLYDKKTVDEIISFVAEFSKSVDECSPPFWFKE